MRVYGETLVKEERRSSVRSRRFKVRVPIRIYDQSTREDMYTTKLICQLYICIVYVYMSIQVLICVYNR